MKPILITLITLTLLACGEQDFEGGNSYKIKFDDNKKSIDKSPSLLKDTNKIKSKVIDSLIIN